MVDEEVARWIRCHAGGGGGMVDEEVACWRRRWHAGGRVCYLPTSLMTRNIHKTRPYCCDKLHRIQ